MSSEMTQWAQNNALYVVLKSTHSYIRDKETPA